MADNFTFVDESSTTRTVASKEIMVNNVAALHHATVQHGYVPTTYRGTLSFASLASGVDIGPSPGTNKRSGLVWAKFTYLGTVGTVAGQDLLINVKHGSGTILDTPILSFLDKAMIGGPGDTYFHDSMLSGTTSSGVATIGTGATNVATGGTFNVLDVSFVTAGTVRFTFDGGTPSTPTTDDATGYVRHGSIGDTHRFVLPVSVTDFDARATASTDITYNAMEREHCGSTANVAPSYSTVTLGPFSQPYWNDTVNTQFNVSVPVQPAVEGLGGLLVEAMFVVE